jgi:hypothetical protein
MCAGGPDDSFTVFEKRKYQIAGQSVRSSVVLHNIAMNAKKPFARGADPKIAVAIDNHVGHPHFASIEGGSYK